MPFAIDATVPLWPVLVLVGTGLLFIAGLHWKVFMQSSDIKIMKQELGRLQGAAAMRDDLRKLEKELEAQNFSQQKFELAVTDRLARIETTIGSGLSRLEATIRDAISKS